MEASGTPGTTPAPAPARGTNEPDRAGAGWRVGAVLLALVLALISAIAIVTMVDVSDTGICADKAFGDCYDFSSSAKTFVLAFGWAGGIAAALSALAALVFAVRGRGGRAVLVGTAITMALLVISIVIARAG